jgi:hypothetical protein
MTRRSLSQSILLATMLLCRLRGQTAVDGKQLHLTAQSHTTTTYAVLPTDCGNLLSFSASSVISITIPQTTVALLAPGCWMDFQNTGPAVATIIPSGVTIDGAASVLLSVGEGLHMVFAGGVFLSVRGGGGVWTNTVTGAGSTPVFAASGTSGVTFLYTLTGNVSSSMLAGPAPGIYIFAITQDSTGGHAFVWPSNVTNVPAVDPGATDTTYLFCQFDGTNCVGIGNFATGPNAMPGITIPGFTSGSNTITAPAAAGAGSQTNLAPNGTTVIPNSCTGQVVQSIAANGTITCGAAGGGSGGSTTQNHGLLFPIGSVGGAALTTSSVSGTLTIPFGCTIAGYNLAFGSGDSGTATVKFWKVASGTAIPTAANAISTSGVSITSGTAIHATSTSDFTTTAVTAFDLMAMAVTAVSGSPESLTGVILCNQ